MQGRYEFVAPCHFGLEAVSKREISDLGYEIVRVEDGKVTFTGDAEALVRANIFLRTTQRILWKVAEFRAVTFEELFQGIKNVPWEEYLPKDARFWVTKATSVKSTLFSTSDIQSIAKKAMVERMKEHYHISWFAETGQDYPVRISIYKDVVTVALDTSGESLHKRGYRKMVSKAPIEETLAAALIKLTPWNKNRILVDPFCGSGTFPIEAAMMGANIAPGMRRTFQAQQWTNLISPSVWQRGFEEAQDLVDVNVDMDIQGYDIDPLIVKAARENAGDVPAASQISSISSSGRSTSCVIRRNMALSSPILLTASAWKTRKTCQSSTERSARHFLIWTAGQNISLPRMRTRSATSAKRRTRTARSTTA